MKERAKKKTAMIAGGVLGVAVGVAAFRRLRAEVEELAEELELAAGVSFEVSTDDGAQIDGIVCGEGSTVVLSYGLGESRAVWVPVATRLLDEGCQVVLYDQRGHGGSTLGDASPAIEVLGHDLKSVLEHLDVKDAVLVGHSMGGMAVQAFAIEHPDVLAERVKALVLVSTGAAKVAGPPIGSWSRLVYGNSVIEWILKGRLGLVFIRPTAGKKIHPTHLMASRDDFTSTPAAVRLSWLRAIQDMDLRGGLANVKVPTTVVVGGRDLMTPPFLAKAIAAHLPGAQLVKVPGGGHQLTYEHPDLLAKMIVEALEAGEIGRTASAAELEEEGLATAGADHDLVVGEPGSDLEEPDLATEETSPAAEAPDLATAAS